MVAEIRQKSSELMSRNKLIEAFDHSEAVISVHEHLDEEELFFPNGASIFYRQELKEFIDQFSEIAFRLDGRTLKTFCAVFFSCPIYERFRATDLSRPRTSEGDIYYDANNRVLEEIGVLQKIFSQSGSIKVLGAPFLPIPFLFVDPNLPAQRFEQNYMPVMRKIAGLKWHPFAQKKKPSDYVRAGYLDLASKYSLPTVIHCERPTEQGDLSALFRDVSPIAEELKVPIDIAHMGFMHSDLKRISDFEFSFIDTSPWSAILASNNPDVSQKQKAEIMAEHLDQIGTSMLFGLDSPFNWQLWSTGERYGAEIKEEIEIIIKAMELASSANAEKMLNKNPRRFLKGLGCEI